MKVPKISTSYRLSAITKKQLKLISEYDQMSEAQIISLAVEKLYTKNYNRVDPERFPKLRNSDYMIL